MFSTSPFSGKSKQTQPLVTFIGMKFCDKTSRVLFYLICPVFAYGLGTVGFRVLWMRESRLREVPLPIATQLKGRRAGAFQLMIFLFLLEPFCSLPQEQTFSCCLRGCYAPLPGASL